LLAAGAVPSWWGVLRVRQDMGAWGLEMGNRPASDVAGGIAEVAVVVDPGRNVEAG
jgi:hypothetical protein